MKRKKLHEFNSIDDIYDEIDMSLYCYYFDIHFVTRNQHNHFSPTHIEKRTVKGEIIKESTNIVYDQLKYYFKQPQALEYFRWKSAHNMGEDYWWSRKHDANNSQLLRIEFTTRNILFQLDKRKILKSIKPKLNKLYKSYNHHKLISEKKKKLVLYKIENKQENNILYL